MTNNAKIKTKQTAPSTPPTTPPTRAALLSEVVAAGAEVELESEPEEVEVDEVERGGTGKLETSGFVSMVSKEGV